MHALTAAVIGTGFIGPVHVEGLQRAGIKVRGILGTTLEKSRSASEKLGLDVAYGSLSELTKDPYIDAVHITSPNRFHYEQVLACLAAKKHVLCEKPLAMNTFESAKLVQAANDSGLVTAVNYNVRYYPLNIEAHHRLKSGISGRVFHATGSYAQDWLQKSTDFNWRVLSQEGGALRAMADIGTHWLDLIQYITGLEVESLCADLQIVHPIRQRPVGGVETFTGKIASDRETTPIELDTEDYGSLLIRFKNGARGTMYVSQVTAGHKNCIRYEIAAANQTLAWNSQNPNRLWIGHRDEPNQELIRDPALMDASAARFTDYPGGHNEGFPDTFKQLFKDFYRYIENRNESNPQDLVKTFPTFEDGHREIQICESILQSAREGRWITLDSTV